MKKKMAIVFWVAVAAIVIVAAIVKRGDQPKTEAVTGKISESGYISDDQEEIPDEPEKERSDDLEELFSAVLEEDPKEDSNEEDDDDWNSGDELDADYIANQSITIYGLDADILEKVGGDEDVMTEALLDQLYGNGFWGYESAEILEVSEDAIDGTVTLSMTVVANETLSVDMIYYIADGMWQLRIW